MNAYFYLFKTELLLAFRHPVRILEPFLFFVLVIFLLAFSSTDQPFNVYSVVWVAAVLSAVVSSQQLFHSEYEEGLIEQLVLSPLSLPVVVLVKVFAHWLVTQFPLVILMPVWSVLFNQSIDNSTLAITLLLGTPILSLVTALGASLTLGIKRGSGLVAVLIGPLMIPTIVLAISIQQEMYPHAAQGLLALLLALLIGSLTLFPFAISAALRSQS